MAKFYGIIGYATTEDKGTGVWKREITERPYYGDLIRNTRRFESSGTLNDNVNIANEISIIADPFAYENFHAMQYVVFMGAKWKISNIDVQHPRLILTLGGLYNG